MSRILQVPFLGQHIDMDTIQSISKAFFIDRMGSGGWFVGFNIQHALQDEPRRYEFDADQFGGIRFESEKRGGLGCHEALTVNGEWITELLEDRDDLLCVKTLQSFLDNQLIPMWKGEMIHPAQVQGTRPPEPKKAVTPEDWIDALGCFWNASIGEAHNKQDSTCFAVVSCINEGILAVQTRLREISDENEA